MKDLLKSSDAIVTWPACQVGRIISQYQKPEKLETRPLIVRPGGLGDLVLLTLAVENLKLNPKDYVWLIETRSQMWADILGLETICYDKGMAATLVKVAAKFKKVINTEQRFGLSQALTLAARSREGATFGFSTNRGAQYFTQSVEYDHENSHEVRQFEKLLSVALGVVAKEQTLKRKRHFETANEPLVAVSGTNMLYKDLSVKKWVELITAWSKGRKFTLSYQPSDKVLAEKILSEFGSQAKLFQGGFKQLCLFIASSEEVFSVDSGLIHVASYYGVPATSVYTASREKKWGPLAEGSRVVHRTDIDCRPCTQFSQVPSCSYNYRCKDVDFDKDVHSIES